MFSSKMIRNTQDRGNSQQGIVVAEVVEMWEAAGLAAFHISTAFPSSPALTRSLFQQSVTNHVDEYTALLYAAL